MNPLSGLLDELEVQRIHLSTRALRSDLGPLDELMVSIVEKGLLQPIVVRPVDDGFEVVAGNRRLEACRRLRWNKIPCHIIELDEREAFEVVLVENIQHRTLKPLEEAEAYKRYANDYGYGGVSELARRIGKSHTYVSRRLALLDLPPALKEELVRRRTTPSVAQKLRSLSGESLGKVVRLVQEQQLSSRAVRLMVKHQREAHRWDGGLSPLFNANHADFGVERRMHEIDRVLGRCITC